jgi:DNA-binding CsgD family transcriptional regulator/PAS domain-containing protein
MHPRVPHVPERLWHIRNRGPALTVSGLLVLAIAAFDWWTKPYLSLAFLYLFPILLAAAFLPRWVIALLALLCAVLAEAFSSLAPPYGFARLTFVTMGLAGCGLYVGELVRNRRRILEYQAGLRALVDTSPAAIVTVDERGLIELANRAAVELMEPVDGHLNGHPIAAFLPDLYNALRREEAPQFRTSMQCRGHRGSGTIFSASVWFSTYRQGPAHKLAAIIGDVGEEELMMVAGAAPGSSSLDVPESRGPATLTARETEILRLVVQGLANKEIAAKMTISESTVKHTLQQLFTKTGVRTRGQLVRVALEQYRSLL